MNAFSQQKAIIISVTAANVLHFNMTEIMPLGLQTINGTFTKVL